MESHRDIILKNVPYGGNREDTAQTVVEFFERLLRENRELKLLLCRLNMVDIPKQTTKDDFETNVFVCFEGRLNHGRCAEMLNWQYEIYRKVITIEHARKIATHGDEFIGCTWINKQYHLYIPTAARLTRPTIYELNDKLESAKIELELKSDEFARNSEELKRKREELAKANEELIEKSKEIERLESALNVSRKNTQTMREQNQYLQDENQGLSDENRKLKAELNKLKAKLERARNELLE